MRLLSLILAGWCTAAHAAEVCIGSVFAPPVRYAASVKSAVLLVDVDGDGRPEILTSGSSVEQSAAITLLANRGDGTFENERQIATGFGDRVEAAGDLNGDGVPDLVVSNYWANGIAVLRGSAALHFDGRVAFETATHGGPSRLVDTDGDGALDIVSFSFGSANPVRVHVFRGRGDGTFEAKRTHTTSLTVAASPTMRVRAGALEFLAGDRSASLSVLRLANDTVSWSTLPAGGFDLNSVFVDVNGDALADIVHTYEGDESDPFEWIFVTLANADGTFQERKQIAHPRTMSFPTALLAGDFDGDGRSDLIAGDFRAATLHFFRGDGTGNFGAGVPFDAGGPVNDLTAADVNSDGRTDLVTVNNDGSVSVIVNRGRCPAPKRRAARH